VGAEVAAEVAAVDESGEGPTPMAARRRAERARPAPADWAPPRGPRAPVPLATRARGAQASRLRPPVVWRWQPWSGPAETAGSPCPRLRLAHPREAGSQPDL